MDHWSVIIQPLIMPSQHHKGKIPVSDNSVSSFFRYILQAATPVYGADEATAIARILMSDITGIPVNAVMISGDFRLKESEMLQLMEYTQRVVAGEPLAYVTGHTEFYFSDFMVTPDVLIPRPETEELVHLVIDAHKSSARPFSVLDIGTGCGCMAVSLRKYLPVATVTALDISVKALDIARKNAERNQVEIELKQLDILDEDQWNTLPAVDIIVSNPPYIARNEASGMADTVLQYEPHIALFADGEDPLIFYRAIARFALQKLNTGGSIYLEINQAWGPETAGIFTRAGFKQVQLLKDLSHNIRFVIVNN